MGVKVVVDMIKVLKVQRKFQRTLSAVFAGNYKISITALNADDKEVLYEIYVIFNY